MRIRTIKPEFYQSEELGEVTREVRHLAAALITWADDEGYFRSHPALIAGALFPFDDDGREFVTKGLTELARVGFVTLFEGGIGHLPGFTRHQVINRASESRLKDKALKPLDSLSAHGAITEPSLLEGKGREVEQGREGKGASAVAAVHPLQAAWNELKSPDQPKWAETSKARKAKADARWRERDDWPEVIRRIAASRFCRGVNDRGWKADPDWLLKPDTAAKVLEGKYDDRAAAHDNRAPVAAESVDWSNAQVGEIAP